MGVTGRNPTWALLRWIAQLALAVLALLACSAASIQAQPDFNQYNSIEHETAPFAKIADGDESLDWQYEWISDQVDQAQYQQPVTPSLESESAVPLPGVAQRSNAQLFGESGVPRSTLAQGAESGIDLVSYDTALGSEAVFRATTDTGDLLGDSPAMLELGVQRRNPIVNDPRVRGSRVGSLAASGSYWVPARIDLDTAVSKIDSRIVDRVTVIPGPYSALYGPGFEVIDVELLKAPRFGPTFETHGATSADYRSNGEQWYGRQSFWGGNDEWGFRGGYGHRAGSDYDSGNGTQIPSSYNSRDVDFALGAQLDCNSTGDFIYLRQDQTDVELAGQAFDISWLVMDGFEVEYVAENQRNYDRLEVEAWYNRTRFEGNAQAPSKRIEFPFYDFINFVGNTDVDSLSTGYSTNLQWEDRQGQRLIAGTDLRFIKQELNEITSGRLGFFEWIDANSPIPNSYSANPGLFAQYNTDAECDSRFTAGARVDLAAMDIVASAAELDPVGVQQTSAAAILGSDDFDQDKLLGAGFMSMEQSLGNDWTAGAKLGYAERSPNLTERYAIEPFMFLIQHGLNTVTGAPTLDKERRWQADIGLARETDRLRLSAILYHAWVFDHITFEAMSVVPSQQDVQQVNLKYVNTDLATFWGAESNAEYDWTNMLTPFATLKYVQGEDHTRNGTFATRQATAMVPSEQVPGLPRGFFSGLGGGATEPLPGILPLESRLGLRWHEATDQPTWGLELAARVVNHQDRVAASLLESTTPGFTVWDVRGFWSPRERLLLVGGVENFTDKQYQEHLDYRAITGQSVFRPGVTFYVGTQWTY